MQNAAESLLGIQTEKNASEVWKECLGLIKENVPFITYNTWFLPIKPFELEKSTLKIYVPNNFFIEWIEEHYNTLINKTISQVLGSDGKLAYVIYEEKISA
ncbi:MAG: DnaA N-terminal domain-containing protein, partial [Melioribacteraceae bacterium]